MRLRNRVVLVVSGLALGISLVYSLYTFAFIYAVEDAFLNAQLAEEAAVQYRHRAQTGRWAVPRDPRIRLHEDAATLPPAIRGLLREEPERVEFPGPGDSHYHLLALATADGKQAWLVYDVGSRLVVRPMRDRLLWLLACTALLLLALSLLAGYWAARRTTRRLEQLASAVADLDPARLPVSWPQSRGHDEVGVVARGLQAMTQRLQAFVERERSFTRDASHELRTPLAVIRTAGDQLASRPQLDEHARRHADLIRTSTARLEQTVSTLLAMAREDPPGGESAQVLVLPLIEQAVVEQAQRLEGKPVEVEVDVPPSARLCAPQAVARIVLANLIGNAFAHTAAGRVRIDTQGDRLRIANTYAGDASAGRDTPFSDREASGDGFGFGLGIVHRLCDRFDLAFELRVVDDTVVAALALEPERAA